MAEPVAKKKIKVPRVVNGVESLVEIEVDDTGGPSWGPRDGHVLLNKPLRRVDGPAKVAGAAVYSYDVRLPGMLFGRILRCPHAHARIREIDTARVTKMSGVKAVVLASDLKTQSSKAPPSDEMLYEGQPVAAVAATTPEIADDAIHAFAVSYEVLPHVVRAEDAIKPKAPQVLKEGNLVEAEKKGNQTKVQAELEKCDAIIEAEYKTSVLHHCCLETHGHVIDYRGGNSATVFASTQHTFSIPKDVSTDLEVPESAVKVVVDHMGGGFGSKFGPGMEGRLASKLSRLAKAPVKLMLTRADEFLMSGNRSGSWQRLKGGVRKDGTLVALEAQQYRLGGVGNGSQRAQPYIYKFETSYSQIYSLHTNVNSSRAMRAPGSPQASFAIESLVDELAHKIGMDPLEFRKKNLPDKAYHRQLDRGASEIGWARRNKFPGSGNGSLRRGLGCAVGAWGGGGGPGNIVTVDVARDGAVKVMVGTQDLGTGTRTYTRAIVAEELGLEMGQVQELIGNSKYGAATGSGGSTTTPSLAPAVKVAAYNARGLLAERVAPLLGVKPEELSFAGGEVRGGGKSLSWKKACAVLPPAGISARGEWKAGLSESGTHGVSFAEVEVDIETGQVQPIKVVHVQDVGLPLNRLAIESQVNGGVIQAMGMALWEGRIMDPALGVMLNPNLNDYKIPGFLEIPEIVTIIDDGDTREGVIGVGEPSVIPAVGALANAVFNASGARIRELPITPDKILTALSDKRRLT